MSLDMLGDSGNETTIVSEPAPAEAIPSDSSTSVQLIGRNPAAQPATHPETNSAPQPTRPASAPARNRDVQLTGYNALATPVKNVSAGPMRSPADAEKAIVQLKEWEPNALAEGLLVHKAEAALQSKRFALAVQERGQEEGPDLFLERLEENPSAVRHIDGAGEGLSAVAKSFQADVNALKAIAEKFATLWEGLVQQSSGTQRGNTISESVATLPFGNSAQAAAALNNRILVLAARRALGRDLPPAGPAAEPLTQCLRFARLNLSQCLSQDPSPANSAYCAGRHGADEVAACIEWATPGGSS